MEGAIVIPARFNSSRFPGKPLAKILGKEMILHVIDRCREAQLALPIIVATDSRDILKLVSSYGCNVELTGEHRSGTDRICEVNSRLDFDYVINVQGDEPIFFPPDIQIIDRKIRESDFLAATGYASLDSEKEISDPNTIKIVVGERDNVVYLSRSPIPGGKNKISNLTKLRQICIYAYKKKGLEAFRSLAPSRNELAEDHELLRYIDNNLSVGAFQMSSRSIPVDVPSDVLSVEEAMVARSE
jgi:3-deoxy-manno-octulosonate cytidylyltransferase (CMP-KDO synthetase)